MKDQRPILERLGLTARDLTVMVFILINAYLIVSGHQTLDKEILHVQQVQAQQATICPQTVLLP
jgi:hypothetical protein